MWTLSLHGPQAAALASDDAPSPSPAQQSASKPEDPWNLDQLFAEVDRFCGHMLALPEAANHTEFKQQLDLRGDWRPNSRSGSAAPGLRRHWSFITGSKQKLKLAQAEEFARLKARREKLDAATQAAQQREQARRMKIEERNRPLPALDGNALSRALLENLGFND
jgi:hypothetical protein